MRRAPIIGAAVVSLAILCAVRWIAAGQLPSAESRPAVQKGAARAETAGGPMAAPSNQTAGSPKAAPSHSNKDDIPFASPHASAVEIASADDAWGGPRSGNEPTLSERVVQYDIDATLDPKAHVIDAKQRLTWKNRSDQVVSRIYIHLYLNAFEGLGSTFFTERREQSLAFRSDVEIKTGEWGYIELQKVEQNGATVPWSFVHPDGGPDTDHTVARLDLPTPVAPGASAQIDIVFRDRLPRVVARTGWFGSFHMVGQWFPKVGVLELAGERGATAPRWNVHEFHMFSEFYADWGEYDVRITVPKSFQIASTGEEQGTPVESGGMITHRFVQGDIHDFAWMAVDDFAPPLEGAYDGPGSPHVTVKVFYPPEYAASAAPALRATIDSIKWFSETLGPYPYRTSTCIIPPFNAGEAAGMEYQTLFTTVGSASVEPGTFTESILDFVTIHEFGHGYFYGLLASNEFEEPLLDEGLNDYWDMRMMRARGQKVHLTTAFLRRIGIDPTLDGFESERTEGALDPHPGDAIGQNAWDRLNYSQVYHRTATVMHDLEEQLGHEATERAFRAYYAKWHFRHPCTADLRESLAEASGNRETVERVFRQNVYGVEPIDDYVDSLTSDEELPQPGTVFENGKWVEKTEEALEKEIDEQRAAWKKSHPDAKHGGGPYPYRTVAIVRRNGARVPQTLVVKFDDDSTETVRWDDDQRWRRFTFVKPAKATSAQLDPDRRVYLDYNKLNDGRTLEAQRAASHRWTGDVSAIVELLHSLVGTL